ncbi:MAG: hypothetical protein KA004_03615 [Verrucomicrobiales bacterium]|nr:hypothetical protein [Verrucomicrobiales bacterium]
MNMRFLKSFSATCCAAILIAAPGPVRARVDDAHSAAMEAATASVKKGFKIREDYWNGTMKSGEQKAVKAQLYKGNEYWFWLGSAEEDVDLKLELYDTKGQKVGVETMSTKDAVGVRVVPPKTGTYLAVFSLTHKKDKDARLEWALAYGYH